MQAEDLARVIWDQGRDLVWTEDAVTGSAFVGTGETLLSGAEVDSLLESLIVGQQPEGAPADPGLGWTGWLSYEGMRGALGVPGYGEEHGGHRFLHVLDGVRFTPDSPPRWVVQDSVRGPERERLCAAARQRWAAALTAFAQTGPARSGPVQAGVAQSGPAPEGPLAGGAQPPSSGKVLWAHTREEYLGAVADAQAAIVEGEVFVLCLTTRATVAGEWDAFETFLALREASPTQHLALLRLGEVSLVAASPELLLRLDGARRARTHPIKGTRARVPDPELDALEAQALAADPKERAENLMIVDVARNDMSRVCEPGSVRVERLWGVDSYAGLHQLVSEVSGTVEQGVSVGEVLRSLAPGCSMTGAPKHRAAQLIQDLEPVPRGLYSGCFGTVGPGGTVELAMAIRCAVMTADAASVGVGGGITSDSVPEREWAEVHLKARLTLGALRASSPVEGSGERG